MFRVYNFIFIIHKAQLEVIVNIKDKIKKTPERWQNIEKIKLEKWSTTELLYMFSYNLIHHATSAKAFNLHLGYAGYYKA